MTTATAVAPTTLKHDVADLGLADKGKKRVLWADQDMPVLQQIRADASLDGVPVVMCTVRAGALDRARGYGEGADAYEAKPFDLEQLLGTVRRLAEMDVDALVARRAGLSTGS